MKSRSFSTSLHAHTLQRTPERTSPRTSEQPQARVAVSQWSLDQCLLAKQRNFFETSITTRSLGLLTLLSSTTREIEAALQEQQGVGLLTKLFGHKHCCPSARTAKFCITISMIQALLPSSMSVNLCLPFVQSINSDLNICLASPQSKGIQPMVIKSDKDNRYDASRLSTHDGHTRVYFTFLPHARVHILTKADMFAMSHSGRDIMS